MTLSDEFLAKGIVKFPVENKYSLEDIRAGIKDIVFKKLIKLSKHDDAHWKLDEIHKIIPVVGLNEFRMSVIKELNAAEWFKAAYMNLAKNALHELVGNELVMQRNINLSIQIPGDDSSLLPIHADVLQGDSPYEVVLWVALVDCYDSKSTFFSRKQPSIAGKSLAQLYAECDPYFVDCKYGEAIIFSQNYLHGNRINETNETRWSMNCRFKSLFSPYADKKLGEFFEPVEIRPATKMGLKWRTE